MVFTEENKVLIKFSRENKHYGAKRFLKEFPAKQWPLSEWTEQNLGENQRERLYRTNGRGRCAETTASNALSRCAHVSKVKGGHFEHKFSQQVQTTACRSQLFVSLNEFID